MKPLRFAVMLEQPLEIGGGFQQPLNDMLWFREWAAKSGNEIVVFSQDRKTLQILKEFGVEGKLLKLGALDKLHLLLKYSRLFDVLQIALRWTSLFEKILIRSGIDAVYFTSTSKRYLLLNKLPFIIAIFDGCHRDAPEFEEVRSFGEFERREALFGFASIKSALVIANAPELIDLLCRRYGMERDRAICIPLSPSTYVSRSAPDEAADAAVLKKYGIEPGYLFYPAQFWPHKNHAALLAALALLQKQGSSERLVLCGSDRGFIDKIRAMIADYGLTDKVSIIGFVESSELAALYRGALALVMPTYFGPTNIPPLEAWTLGTPVIYPEAFKAQAGDAALLFDYDDPHSLAEAIVSVRSAETRERLRKAGYDRLQHFASEIEAGRRQLAFHLERLKNRLVLTRR